MKEKLLLAFDDYIKSFNNVDEGFSRKKVLATIVVLSSLVMELKWTWKTQDFRQMESLLIINFAFVSSLLGISTYEKIKTSKQEQKP